MGVEQPVKAVKSLDALEPDLRFRGTLLKTAPRERYIPRVPAPKKPDDRQFKFGNKIRSPSSREDPCVCSKHESTSER